MAAVNCANPKLRRHAGATAGNDIGCGLHKTIKPAAAGKSRTVGKLLPATANCRLNALAFRSFADRALSRPRNVANRRADAKQERLPRPMSKPHAEVRKWIQYQDSVLKQPVNLEFRGIDSFLEMRKASSSKNENEFRVGASRSRSLRDRFDGSQPRERPENYR